MKIKKYINLSLILLLAGLIYSCSGDNIINGEFPIDPGTGENKKEEKTTLSIFFDQPEEDKTKSASNMDENAEKQIYNVDILIFRSADQSEPGKLDNYIHIPRTTRAVIGQNYSQEYVPITEAKNLAVSAGKRDIYVIVNAPESALGHFNGVADLATFKNRMEELSTQGMIPHPGTVTPDPDDDPIGGIKPSDWKTNLTMCGVFLNAQFNNLSSQHYLGYTTSTGIPAGAPLGSVALDPNANPFYLERLAARVAMKKINFNFSANPNLLFETGSAAVTPDNYTYQLDSVFLLNAKTKSRYYVQPANKVTGSFGHGCVNGFNYLKGVLTNINAGSVRTDYLTEPIFAREYDIANTGANSTPIWFYTYENDLSENNPTYLVIGVRFNFKSAKDGKLKTAKYYYPIIVNKPGTSTHSYIKRNTQYFITANIKGLGSKYSKGASELKSAAIDELDESIIEVEQEIGDNLFPWTGNIYK